MKITTLFESYEHLITEQNNCDAIFAESGMVNNYEKLDFGFFPLGSGILVNEFEDCKIENATIKENGTMILGNDFGTITYLKTKCKNKRENSNKTIANLQYVGLDIKTTFFTNLFLGLRNDELHEGTTNTKRIKKLRNDYKKMCFVFFLEQIKLINPKTIICLGAEVGQALSEFSTIFSSFSTKYNKISNLFIDASKQEFIIHTNDSTFGKRKFMLIPHPSFAHINWNKHDIKNQIKNSITKLT